MLRKKCIINFYYEPYTRAIGNATLTVYEPVKNGKNKKIAQIKVTVVPTQIKQKEIKVPVRDGNFSILVYENINGAKYSYKISNPQIVHRQEYDEFIAIKPGTTYITVTENYKGKTTIIGKIKVEAIAAYIPEKNMKISYWDGNPDHFSSFDLMYKSPFFQYSYVSDNPKIVKVDKDGGFFYGLNYGKATITVYETNLNKEKRKVGSITIEVSHTVIVPKTEEIYLTQSYSLYDLVDMSYSSIFNENITYACKSADTSIISIAPDPYDNKMTCLEAVGVGKTTITVYEKNKGIETEICKIKFTVKEPTVKGIEFSQDFIDEMSRLYIGMDYSEYWLQDYLEYNPSFVYNIPPVTFSSSNEKVVKIMTGQEEVPVSVGSSDNEVEYMVLDYQYLVPVSEGIATITVVCGNSSTELHVTVKKINK